MNNVKKTAEMVLCGIAKGTVEYGDQMVECTVKYGERTEYKEEYRERTVECTVEYRELTRHRTEYGESTN